MEGHEGFSSAAVHELFCSAPKLRRFAGVSRDRFYGRDVKLDAGVNIWTSSREWACLRLESLKELVLGIDDVDLLEEVRMAEEESEGEYYDSGGEDNGVQRGFQYECLEMSLRSGMGQMCGLKELRSLKVEAMATRFWKEEEQAWVRAQWPRFVSGRKRGDDDEEEEKRKKKVKERYIDRFWMDYGLPEYL
ncbi:hypothetical protein BGZ95_010890 [Linnemannia exigua]|uniref:Uncharacterized protein n=1 Tax=Linnemannia exigua TaxID=604196 RepID=A0AAD4DAN7_9FUNG|nr:hypothetical protein BGZ95_010890 [Linnemannia exigua]